ncbi:hypothetical protein NOK12_08520 [Nocardioides sp. OK12]|uniref:DUF2786 domain-containing protein n=1 Tax=Nocardioides marinisabuli TaxID=419476 RepID=A0A7Y9F095_9ACTN|nr:MULTISPECIES: DUF2786 domain-containing protein [Nocardioides]NYD57227.1 hypothetical protein [Nocardioides marinisabuli]GHJ58333.1 hypothetical protein NOK12_08520 [Nocardioides sp. OK12]
MSAFIDKLAKVLAQAEAASTPEEAEAFLAKAQYLSTRWSIDLATARQHTERQEQRAEPVQRTITIGEARAMGNSRLVALFLACAQPNDVRADVARNSTTVYAYGFPSDLEVVEALYVHLALQMVHDAGAFLASDAHLVDAAVWNPRTGTFAPPSKKTARLAFYEAFVEQIAARLWAARRDAEARAERERLEAAEADPGASTALVLAEKEAEVADFYGRTSTARGSWQAGRRRTGLDGGVAAWEAGTRSGAAARLSAAKRLPGGRTQIA